MTKETIDYGFIKQFDFNRRSAMTKETIDYGFIKQWLKRGELKSIAEKYGIHRNSATRILKGEYNNYDFVEIVYRAAMERAQTFLAIHQKVNELKEQTKSL